MSQKSIKKRLSLLKQTSGYNPVKIPEIVIERLKDYEPCYIKVWAPEPDNDKSGKAAFEPGFEKKPYNHDDPEIQEWLKSGGNYGIMATRGLIIIETDCKETNEKLSHIKTLTGLSGSGRGLHRFFRSCYTW